MKLVLAVALCLLASCGESDQARKERETRERDARVAKLLEELRTKDTEAQRQSAEYWKQVALSRKQEPSQIVFEEAPAAGDGIEVENLREDVARAREDASAQHREQMQAIEDSREEQERRIQQLERDERHRRMGWEIPPR